MHSGWGEEEKGSRDGAEGGYCPHRDEWRITTKEL